MQNNYMLKLIEKIKIAFDDFLHKKISLIELQNMMSAIEGCFDNSMNSNIKLALDSFIEELEEIRFMYNPDEHFKKVSKKIRDLKELIKNEM